MKKNKLEIICRFTLKYKPSAIFEFLYGKYQNMLVIYTILPLDIILDQYLDMGIL